MLDDVRAEPGDPQCVVRRIVGDAARIIESAGAEHDDGIRPVRVPACDLARQETRHVIERPIGRAIDIGAEAVQAAGVDRAKEVSVKVVLAAAGVFGAARRPDGVVDGNRIIEVHGAHIEQDA